MARNPSILFIALSAVLLGGCSATPPARFYVLEPVDVSAEKAADAVAVGMGPFAFPDYLKRPQIVTRLSNSQLRFAEFDRWAEPIDNAFVQHLAMNVDAELAGAVILPFPYKVLGDVDYRVAGRVLHFDADESGRATLHVQWAAYQGEDVLFRARSSTYTAQVTETGDYASIVRALNETVKSFSREVAAELRTAIVAAGQAAD